MVSALVFHSLIAFFFLAAGLQVPLALLPVGTPYTRTPYTRTPYTHLSLEDHLLP
jgi:hypothetical protein